MNVKIYRHNDNKARGTKYWVVIEDRGYPFGAFPSHMIGHLKGFNSDCGYGFSPNPNLSNYGIIEEFDTDA